jgi:hypothetical protein
MPNLTWFYFHVGLALIIIITDANGTLEPAVNKFEQKIGLYTPPDTIDSTPPYYIEPIESDSIELNILNQTTYTNKQ